MGDPGTAVADLTRAVEIAPDPALLFNRALAHQALGNWAAAEADFTAVLDAEPAEAEARLRRAECRRRQAAATALQYPDAGVMLAGSAP